MDTERIKKLLEGISEGQLSVEKGMEALKDLPFEDLGFARIDHHRELRTGVPEIVFGEKKEAPEISKILRRMSERSDIVMVSRVSPEKGVVLLREFPDARYHETARLFVWGEAKRPVEDRAPIFVLAAGTSDIPVAEEARLTAMSLGNRVEHRYDVGVAGLQRLLPEVPRLRESSVIIAVAGMEGALPSVVAGLVGRPIIAVPTSVGYGASYGGIAALLAMLNSCVPGVTVVNIDNGVGAAVAAHLINAPHPSTSGGHPLPPRGEGTT